MTFYKAKYYIVLITIIFSWSNFAYANIEINEVQISPTEGRFIELYNTGSSSIDLTNWYIQRKTATGIFGSLISKTNFENKTIEANGYFVISKSSMPETNIVVDNLTLTESNAIQIKNGEGNVVDKVGWGSSDDCGSSCAPNSTSGKSIQKNTDGSWDISSPTPGSQNRISLENENNEVNNSTNIESNTDVTSSSSSTEPLEILKITTKIISPKTVSAGIPFQISSETTTNRKEKYEVGKYVWNFGDGKEMEFAKSTPFNYTYDYPGEYVLGLSYFESILNKEVDSMDKMTIKVVPAGIFISSIGADADPFVELENKSNYELILSNWVVTAGMHYFIIPKGTTLLSGKKIKLSPKITGFMSEDMYSVSIANPNNEINVQYQSPTKTYIKNNLPVNDVISSESVVPKAVKEDNLIKSSNEINLNDLGADVAGTKINLSKESYALIGLMVVIGLGIVSYLLIKKKNNIGDYVERELRAEDMTIIE